MTQLPSFPDQDYESEEAGDGDSEVSDEADEGSLDPVLANGSGHDSAPSDPSAVVILASQDSAAEPLVEEPCMAELQTALAETGDERQDASSVVAEVGSEAAEGTMQGGTPEAVQAELEEGQPPSCDQAGETAGGPCRPTTLKRMHTGLEPVAKHLDFEDVACEEVKTEPSSSQMGDNPKSSMGREKVTWQEHDEKDMDMRIKALQEKLFQAKKQQTAQCPSCF